MFFYITFTLFLIIKKSKVFMDQSSDLIFFSVTDLQLISASSGVDGGIKIEGHGILSEKVEALLQSCWLQETHGNYD